MRNAKIISLAICIFLVVIGLQYIPENVRELLGYWPLIISTALFVGGLLSAVLFTKRNAANRQWAGWIYTLGKVTFWASLTCALLNYFLDTFWFLELVIWVFMVYRETPSALERLVEIGDNEVHMIQNTLLGREENKIPIYRVGKPGWNWLVFADKVPYVHKIDKDISITHKKVLIELQDAPMFVDITYTSRPDPDSMQDYTEVSGGDPIKREKIIIDVFDALVMARTSDKLRKETRKRLISEKEKLMEELGDETNFPRFAKEKEYGEKIGDILIGNVDDTNEVRNAYEQMQVLIMQTDAALAVFKKRHGREPDADNEDDQAKLNKYIEDAQVADDEVDKVIWDIRGLDGMSPGQKATAVAGLGHTMRGNKKPNK